MVSDKYITPSKDITVKLFSINDIEELLNINEEIAYNTRLVLGLLAIGDGDIGKIRKYL